jgi:hypothetical protein
MPEQCHEKFLKISLTDLWKTIFSHVYYDAVFKHKSNNL